MSLLRFFRRSRWDDERARELAAHLAIETDENVARGMPPAEARLAARRKLGNQVRIREDIYQMNTIGLVDSTWRDLKYGLRLLRLNPAFALVAVLSLALGVGANAAIFQLLDAVRLRPLPVTHPEQLVRVRIASEPGHNPSGALLGDHPDLTNPLWERIRDRQQAFSSVLAWGTPGFELSAGGESREARGLWVSGDFFRTLNVRPVLGRLLSATDDRRGCTMPPVVISYAFWQREYGGAASALGRTIMLDGQPFEIAGVTPASFFGVEVGRDYDVAAPLCAEALVTGSRSFLDRKDAWFLGVIGRLKPGWTAETATAHLQTIAPAMFRETVAAYRPEEERDYLRFSLKAIPAATGVSVIRAAYESPLWLLLATTALVLLIACANLANLMLARATAREREIAVRLALGASRGRIVRQLLAESVLIAAAGAAAGGALAQWLSSALVASLTTESDRVFIALSGDWRVFGFVALLATAACVLFGLVPALRATSTRPGVALKANGRGATGTRGPFGLRRALVVVQIALSLVLVVGALLFARSLINVLTIDTGFAKDAILVAALDFRRTGLPESGVRAAHDDFLQRLRRQPGIEEAARVRIVPVSGNFSNRNIVVNGVVREESVNRNVIGDRYFETVRSPLLAGRDFDDRDTATSAKVAIVTESFARVFFDGANPIGRTFQIDEPNGVPRPVYEIVGLARDAKYEDIREAFAPLMYLPAAQDGQFASTLRVLVRSKQPLAATTAAITALARAASPSVVVLFRTLESQLRDALLRDRLMAQLSGFFGGLAALIAVIGVYGVMSYSVARRRNEIGIRLALGAERADVVRMVMHEAGTLLTAGLVCGTLMSLAAGRAASALLYGLNPYDPATLGAAVVGLSAIAALASYVPAWRASRLEPTIALREE